LSTGDVRVVNTANNETLGWLSQSVVSPYATHVGMLEEGIQFNCKPKKKNYVTK
jgi:hypothetical protein